MVRYIAGEHIKDTLHDRVRDRDDGPLFPTTGGQTLIQRREIRPLGPYGGMGELGQDGSQGTIPLAGFARALLARTFVIAWSYAGPGCQSGRRLEPRYGSVSKVEMTPLHCPSKGRA